MAGALVGIGQGLQDFARTFLAAKQNQLERQRQGVLDDATLADDAARRKTEGLQQQQIQATLNDLPMKQAGEDADSLAKALGDEGKFGSQAWVDLMKKRGIPVPTRDPIPTYDNVDPQGKFSFIEDNSVDPTTHAVLPPEVLGARAARDMAMSKDRTIMNVLNDVQRGSGVKETDLSNPTPGQRAAYTMAGLGTMLPPVGGVPVTNVETVGDTAGKYPGQRVRAGVERSGKHAWEEPIPDDPDALKNIDSNVQVTQKGGRYLDLSKFQGKERNQAQALASKNGIISVDQAQADSLQTVDVARSNLSSMFNSIKAKLPTDPKGRITGFTDRALGQLLQTDTDRAAFNAWNTTAIPMLRAIAGKLPRVNSVELTTALDAAPTINDTVGTAAAKMKAIQTAMDNVEHSILGTYESKQPGKSESVTPTLPTPAAAPAADGEPPPPTANTAAPQSWTRNQYNTFLQQNPDVKGSELQQKLRANGISIIP